MTDPCDDPKYDQHVAYDKKVDCYEIGDEYGDVTLNTRELRKLLELVKKTHPEIIQEVLGK